MAYTTILLENPKNRNNLLQQQWSGLTETKRKYCEQLVAFGSILSTATCSQQERQSAAANKRRHFRIDAEIIQRGR